MCWSTVRLRTEVEGLRSLVNGLSLNSTVYYPQTDTNDDFAESSESVAIDPNDPEKLLVTFSSMPREISDGETAKFLIHSNGQSWECEPATTNPYSGSLTIPLVDDYSVYLALTGADGGTRNLFVASESSLKDRFSLFVTAAWQDGRRTANYAGYIETMVYCGGDDVKPVSGRVVLEKDGRQVKEQEIDVKGSLSERRIRRCRRILRRCHFLYADKLARSGRHARLRPQGRDHRQLRPRVHGRRRISRL